MDHESRCAILFGYNWCTCIRYTEQQVERGYDLHIRRAGEVRCPGDHTQTRCATCRAEA